MLASCGGSSGGCTDRTGPAVFAGLAVATIVYIRRKASRAKLEKKHARLKEARDFEAAVKGGPLFSFGVIADIQYADADDAWDFAKENKRYYRTALDSVSAAVDDWNKPSDCPISFVAQLGDIIDGRCAVECGSSVALTAVLQQLSKVRCPDDIHDVVGNHEMYNFTRPEMLEAGMFKPWLRHRPKECGGPLRLPYDAASVDAASKKTFRFYYDYSPAPGWRFIVIDGYDWTTIGPEDATTEAAFKYLEARNPNNVRTSADWLKGLEGPPRRFVPFNGAIGPGQLAWLRSTVRQARSANEVIVLLTHIPIHPESCRRPTTLVWNYEEILETLYTEGEGHVLAVLAGHSHQGGYALDHKGVHHVTVEAPLECPPGTLAYGHAEAFGSLAEGDAPPMLVIKGTGRVPALRVMKMSAR